MFVESLLLSLTVLLFLFVMLLVIMFVVPLALLLLFLFMGNVPEFERLSTLFEKLIIVSSFTSSGLPMLDETELGAIDELLLVLQVLFIILLLPRQGGPTFSLLSRLLSPSMLKSLSDTLPVLSKLLSRSTSSSISEPNERHTEKKVCKQSNNNKK